MSEVKLLIDGKVLEVEEGRLMTQAEMAKEMGLSVAEVCIRLKELCLLPKEKANRTSGIAAKYDYDVFLNLQQQQQQRKLKEEHDKMLNAYVNKLDVEKKGAVLRGHIQALKDDKSEASTKQILQSAAGFLAMLHERIEFLHNDNILKDKIIEDQSLKIEEQGIKLDEHDNYLSVTRINEIGKYKWSLKECKSVGISLSKFCRENGVNPKEVPSQDIRWKTVNVYRVDQIHAFGLLNDYT